MKKQLALLICLLLAATLAGCASPVSGTGAAETPADVVAAPETAEPTAAPTTDAIAPESDDPMTRTIYVGDKTLTLKLKGKATDIEGVYGISSIDVYDGDTLLQTLEASEAITAEWGADDTQDTTEGYQPDGGLTVSDMNFDGAGDIGLQGWITAGANVPYYYWLWNANTQRFSYAFCLCNAEVDTANKQIVTSLRESAGCTETDVYAYDENGALKLQTRRIETENENTAVSESLTALLEDMTGSLHSGTAGSSLIAAKYAAMLLDFGADSQPMPDYDSIGAAVSRLYFALDDDAQAEFDSQIALLYETAKSLEGDADLAILEDAGYTPAHAPWETGSAEQIFSGICWGMGQDLPLSEN